jgi:hypothetical protein
LFGESGLLVRDQELVIQSAKFGLESNLFDLVAFFLQNVSQATAILLEIRSDLPGQAKVGLAIIEHGSMFRFLFDFTSPGLENAVEDGNGEGRWNAEEFARIAGQSGFDCGSADIQVIRSDLCFAALFEDAYEPGGEFEGSGRLARLLAIAVLPRTLQGRKPLSRLGEPVLDCEKRVAGGFGVDLQIRRVGRSIEDVEQRNLSGRDSGHRHGEKGARDRKDE